MSEDKCKYPPCAEGHYIFHNEVLIPKCLTDCEVKMKKTELFLLLCTNAQVPPLFCLSATYFVYAVNS